MKVTNTQEIQQEITSFITNNSHFQLQDDRESLINYMCTILMNNDLITSDVYRKIDDEMKLEYQIGNYEDFLSLPMDIKLDIFKEYLNEELNKILNMYFGTVEFNEKKEIEEVKKISKQFVQIYADVLLKYLKSDKNIPEYELMLWKNLYIFKFIVELINYDNCPKIECNKEDIE